MFLWGENTITMVVKHHHYGGKMMARGLNIDLPPVAKEELVRMSDETNMSQAALIKLATLSLLENYKHKGAFIFADLLNPEHKENRR